MGFGSYDESEQERQEYGTDDLDENDAVDTAENTHDGSVEYEIGASNDELLNQLEEIKEK